jgi:p-aminobenzoyl-glutamate transporter AbgT
MAARMEVATEAPATAAAVLGMVVVVAVAAGLAAVAAVVTVAPLGAMAVMEMALGRRRPQVSICSQMNRLLQHKQANCRWHLLLSSQ